MNQFLKTAPEITAWLDQMEIVNYTLKPDITYGFTVEVVGNVDLSSCSLEAVPIKFNLIGGDLDCSNNFLTRLNFCPETVGGDFSCEHNALTSLNFSPPNIQSSFYCAHNR